MWTYSKTSSRQDKNLCFICSGFWREEIQTEPSTIETAEGSRDLLVFRRTGTLLHHISHSEIKYSGCSCLLTCWQCLRAFVFYRSWRNRLWTEGGLQGGWELRCSHPGGPILLTHRLPSGAMAGGKWHWEHREVRWLSLLFKSILNDFNAAWTVFVKSE